MTPTRRGSRSGGPSERWGVHLATRELDALGKTVFSGADVYAAHRGAAASVARTRGSDSRLDGLAIVATA